MTIAEFTVIHIFETAMFLPLPRETVFAFFAAAENLARITPPGMGFHLRSSGPITIDEGTELEYGLRVFGVPIRWRSLISGWDPPRHFVDTQLAGPYKSWIHTHHFDERPDGTTIEDSVRYELPWRLLGELAYPLVRRQLTAIFRYRQEAIERILRDKISGP